MSVVFGIASRDGTSIAVEQCLNSASHAILMSSSQPAVFCVSEGPPRIDREFIVHSVSRATLLQYLTCTSVPQDVVEFALYGSGEGAIDTGAIRNTLQLASAGTRLVSIDDDVFLDPVMCCSPTFRPVARQASETDDARTYIPFESLDVALETMQQADVDIISELTADSGSERSSDIVATMCGIVGDCGIGWGARMLFLPFAGPKLYDTELYHTLKRSRWCIRTIDSSKCSSSPFFMSTIFSVNNRSMLPPFLPNFRNQDGLFGMMIKMSTPDAKFRYVPYVAKHIPRSERKFSYGEFTTPVPWRMARAVGCLLAIHSPSTPHPADVPEWCEAAGTKLEMLGELPVNRLLACLYEAYLFHCGNASRFLLKRIEAIPDMCEIARVDMISLLSAYRVQSSNPLLSIPFDVPVTIGSRLEATSSYLIKFGRLLRYWPHLWRRACDYDRPWIT